MILTIEVSRSVSYNDTCDTAFWLFMLKLSELLTVYRASSIKSHQQVLTVVQLSYLAVRL